MDNKKIFILMPDGVGLRNFAYSKFYEIGREQGFDIVYWNSTIFPLADLGFSEIRIQNAKTHRLADIFKNVRKHIELDLSIKKSNDTIYDGYRFKLTYGSIKTAIRSIITRSLIATHQSENGLRKIREAIKKNERSTPYYRQCIDTLKKEKPAMVFCTNQRHIIAVAPILAAQDLGIPTATFIFSWDNLPKATMVVEADYYFVWSELMKEQLLDYYPYVKAEQVFITGTPQFEPHFDLATILPRDVFFRQNGLNPDKRYICFSGDDVTTSPDDPQYLEDAALAVKQLNEKGRNLGIIFRRCPVDFTTRYDAIIAKYKDIIVAVDPKWESFDKDWHAVLPKPEDGELLSNTMAHSEMAINLGSSMVFDAVSFGRPCGYLNYNQKVKANPEWDVHKCYQFIHFRSMPSRDAVIWLDSPEALADTIDAALSQSNAVAETQKWFEVINKHPAQEASTRIWKSISEILNTE